MGGKGSGRKGRGWRFFNKGESSAKDEGRVPSDKGEPVLFWSNSETMELLRRLIPPEKRSDFVEDALRVALKLKIKELKGNKILW